MRNLVSRMSFYAAIALMSDDALAAPAAVGRILPDLTAPAKAPKFSTVRSDLLPPEVGKRGGGGGPGEQYPFATLEIGQSFGVKGRTAKRMASTVYSAMTRFGKVTPKLNPDGTPVLTKPGKKSVGGKPVMELTKVRVFIVRDVDAKTDPDGADVRIWRIADGDGSKETVTAE